MKMQKIKLLTALTIAVLLPAAAVWAGPTWQFGPEDQGRLKLDYLGQFQLTVRDSGSGPDGDDTTEEFNFRRNRLALIGDYGGHLGLYVQTEFWEDVNISALSVGDGDQSDFQLLDAVFRFDYKDPLHFWVGKFKQVLTRENLENCFAPLSLDRSLFIRTPLSDAGTRDKGVELWGNLFEKHFQYRAAVTNGRNDSTSAPESNFRYTVRGHVSLLNPESSHGYRSTYLGKEKVLTLGAGYQLEKDVAYDNVAAGTGEVDYKGWSADLFFEYPLEGIGTFTFSGAYSDYDLDDAYKGADPDPDVIGLNGEKNGSYLKFGYMLPNLPLQLFGRWEEWSFAELQNVVNQEILWYAGGFNYYFWGQNLKLTMELSRTDFDKDGTFDGVKTEDFTTFTTQLQVIF
jgi:hypothetical protein